MKTLMLIIGMIVATTIGANAQSKTMINLKDLPQTITTDLSNARQSWKPSEAFKVDTKGVITYEVIAVKDKEEFLLKYDNNGKFLSQEPYHRSKTMKDEKKPTQNSAVHSSASKTSARKPVPNKSHTH
jgi:hypothetical protein